MNRWTVPAAVLAIALAGCGRDASNTPQAPLTPPSLASSGNAAAASLFQPLSIGDRWTYERIVHVETTPSGESDEFHARIEREVVGEENVGGVAYRIVEERTYDEGDVVPSIYRLYWRQDRNGLYFIDVPPPGPLNPLAARAPADAGLRLPPSLSDDARRGLDALLVKRAAFLASIGAGRPVSSVSPRSAGPVIAGEAPAEYPFLVYPLRTGSSWIERPAGDPFEFKRTVVGRENLDLPTGRTSAWRVRHELEAFGPNDSAAFWYDRNGSPGYVFQAEFINTAPDGTPLFTSTWHETVTLTSFDLTGPGR